MALTSLSGALQSTPVHAEEIPTQVVNLDDLIKADAAKWHVSEDHLYGTLKCESNFKVDAIGDKGLAHGLAQIRSDFHPDVSLEEANDPEFAVNFMAQYFSEGKESQWSCWRQLYGK